jgi:hypothetical protein
MKLNFKKIASVLTSTVMLSSTIGLAAAANYPAPFVKGGAADVAVVWGSAAAATDLVAVTDITADLQAELAAQSGSSSGSTSSSSVSGGDYVKIAKTGNNFNLGNTMNGVFGARVDKDNLPTLLADGTYLNGQNTEYNYEQSITLNNLKLTHFADSDYNDKTPTLGFKVASGTNVLNYTYDLTTSAESTVTSGHYVDFETTELNLMGKSYYVLSATNSTATATQLGKFTLLDSANTAIVAEGETQKVTVGDKSYDVAINYVGSSTVKLDVDGQVTNSLAEGQTYKLTDGTYVGIKDILYNSKDTGVSKVEFSIGSGKLELQSGSEIQMNDDTVAGVTAYIYGTQASNVGSLDKITISWVTDDNMFITPTSTLTMPGFGALKLSMGDFTTPEQEVTNIQNDGDSSIELEAPIKDGTAKLNILFANSSGEYYGVGKASDERLATSPFSNLNYTATSGADKLFVASYATSSEAESYLLSASVDETNGKNRTTIKNEVTGEDVCKDKAIGDTCNIGSASFTIDAVNKSGSTKTVSFDVGTGTNFSTLYTNDGLMIYLPYEVANGTAAQLNHYGALNVTGVDGTGEGDLGAGSAGHGGDNFKLYMTEADKDGTIANGGTFYLTLDDNADGKVQVASTNVTTYEIGSSEKYEGYVYSDLATKVSLDKNPDQDTAEVEYHGGESFADVYLTAAGATVSSEGTVTTTGTVKKLGSVAVSDAEAASVAGKNLIVVGGSCVNTVAASLLGGALCSADFEAKTGAGAGSFVIETFSQSSGKVATLVAGYNAADTTNAAKYLTTQTVDTTAGKTYKGTSATSATLVTTA